jgi:hypothetical protein
VCDLRTEDIGVTCQRLGLVTRPVGADLVRFQMWAVVLQNWPRASDEEAHSLLSADDLAIKASMVWLLRRCFLREFSRCV